MPRRRLRTEAAAPGAPAAGWAGGRSGCRRRLPGRRWAWRSVGLLLTFLLVLYLGGPLLAGAQGAGSCCPGSSRRWLVVAVALEAGAIASYSRV